MTVPNQAALKQGLEAVLSQFQPDPKSQLPLEVQKAVYLAGLLQARATALQTPAERRQQAPGHLLIVSLKAAQATRSKHGVSR